MRFVLDAAYLALIGALSPFFLYKAATTGKYREGMARKWRGVPPARPTGKRVVWIHAVSVGEVLLIAPLVKRLIAERPDLAPVLSVTTNTGYALARERYPDIPVFYAPLDFSWAVKRCLTGLDPALLVLTELELWPNLLLAAKRRGTPVAVVNARMSDRSHRGYRKIRSLLRGPLSAIHWWGAQSEEYAARIRDLVGPDASVSVTGSMKYDGAVRDRDNARTRQLRDLLGFTGNETIFLAGSTQSPEEEILLDLFERQVGQHPSLRLVLVPRHKERFDAVADLLKKRRANFVRRSEIKAPLPSPAPVTLVDTIGELSYLWGLADVGFVGGSLENDRGGQSMIEPAGFGVPLCFGPHTWNFKETVSRLLEAKGAVQIGDRAELEETIATWLADPAAARVVGDNARRFIDRQQGAVVKTFTAIEELLDPSEPSAKRRSA